MSGDQRYDPYSTAIKRKASKPFSNPIEFVLKNNLLEGAGNILDFGCGYGQDVLHLRKNGFQAFGWDPLLAFEESRPENSYGFLFYGNEEYARLKKMSFDVILCIYVLNVLNETDRKFAVDRAAFLTGSRTKLWFFVRDDVGGQAGPRQWDAKSVQDCVLDGCCAGARCFRLVNLLEV
jgi:SAM-dependent methyltransferase